MKRFKCLVKECGHVTRTRTGIATHIKRKHPGKEVVRGTTFSPTRDALSNPKRNGPNPHKAKKRKTVKTTPFFTDAAQSVDIPCILRVNIKGLKVAGIYPVSG